jgi:hypothetical protein
LATAPLVGESLAFSTSAADRAGDKVTEPTRLFGVKRLVPPLVTEPTLNIDFINECESWVRLSAVAIAPMLTLASIIGTAPANELGIVPIRCTSCLLGSMMWWVLTSSF